MIQIPIEYFDKFVYTLGNREYTTEIQDDKIFVSIKSSEPLFRILIEDGMLVKLLNKSNNYGMIPLSNNKAEIVNEYFMNLVGMNFNSLIDHLRNLDENVIRSKTDFWNSISKHKYLSLDFIRDYKDNLNWNYISEIQITSDEFLSEFSNKILWSYIAKRELSEDIMRKFKDFLDGDTLSGTQQLSEEFVEEFKDMFLSIHCSPKNRFSEKFILKHLNEISWYSISEYGNISDDFIIIYKNMLNWSVMLNHRKLSVRVLIECFGYYNLGVFFYQNQKVDEEFILKFMDELKLNDILSNNTISESFLEMLIEKIGEDNVNWYNVFGYHKLSQDFISKYQKYTNIDKLLLYQDMPEEFILDNINRSNYYSIIKNRKFPEDLVLKIKDHVIKNYRMSDNMNIILKYQDLSEEFIENNIDRLSVMDIIYHQKLSEEFMDRHWDILEPFAGTISSNQKLSEEFMDRHWDILEPFAGTISSNQNISKEFILKHDMKSKLGMGYFEKNRFLSKDFIMSIVDNNNVNLILYYCDIAKDIFEVYIS